MAELVYVILDKAIDEVKINQIGLVKGESLTHYTISFLPSKDIKEVLKESVRIINVFKTGKKKWTELDNGACHECGGACNCYEYKICDRCYILKKRTIDFDWNQNDKWGRATYRPSCKDCRRGIDGVKMPASEKKRASATKPQGIWECPICEKNQIVEMMASPPRMDHDHATGRFRDWICDSCNTGLGRFKDDISTLKTAIEYLKKDYS